MVVSPVFPRAKGGKSIAPSILLSPDPCFGSGGLFVTPVFLSRRSIRQDRAEFHFQHADDEMQRNYTGEIASETK
jgi:hypothetical protein